jgi:metallo-beta-lactamase class B
MRFFIMALLTAGAALAQSDPVSRSWNQPVEPFRIAGNVYYVGASDVTSFLITSKDGHILLDGGFVETVPLIRANVEKLGFRLSDVRILISSHAHYDHAGGLAELKRITGATLYASAGDIPLLARGGKDDPQFGDVFLFPSIAADRVLAHGQRITLGGTTMVAHITPGHTPGCTTWTTRTGGLDVVFFCSPSVPGNYRLVGNPRYPDAIADYRRQFAILKTLPCDVFLAGHGSFFGLEEKRKRLANGERDVFKDRRGCDRFVTAMEKRFERVAAEQSKR